MNMNIHAETKLNCALSRVLLMAVAGAILITTYITVPQARAVQKFPGEHLVYRAGIVYISSDADLPQDLCKHIAALAEDCLRYSANQQGLPLNSTFTQPFTLHLDSPELVDSTHPHTGLSCSGSADILARYTVFQNSEFAYGALTHELTHMLHNRIDGGILTHYLEEGNAQNIQRHFDQQFFSDKGRYIEACRKETVLLATMPADEAARLLDQINWSRGDVGATEDLGCLFVEFLRLKLNGSGFPDTYNRIADMCSMLPRMQRTNPRWRELYYQAMRKEFGAGVERAFVAFMHATENKPSERFSGTFFEQWLSDPVVVQKLQSGSGDASTPATTAP